ncbi:MAG: hypothetical protein V3T01_08320 [Myxococcota bacterium]
MTSLACGSLRALRACGSTSLAFGLLRALRACGVAVIAGVFGAAPAVAVEEVDLIGTWHVLVHYRDDHAHNSEAMRWDDRLWVFKPSGSRIRWIEYPIVVFDDKSGRFEHLGTSGAARVVHGWEPNPGQLINIQKGLEFNTRGSKSKTLRGSDEKGWNSQRRSRAASASVITYSEAWSIEGMPDLPEFRRNDVMGSMRGENVEGATVYSTLEVESGGAVLRGRFERDGSRHGTFRMMRAGDIRVVAGSGKTQGQRFMESFAGQYGFTAQSLLGTESLQEYIDEVRAAGEISRTTRMQVRGVIYEWLEQGMQELGQSPKPLKPQLEDLSVRIEKELLDEGRSVEEVVEMIEKGKLRP